MIKTNAYICFCLLVDCPHCHNELELLSSSNNEDDNLSKLVLYQTNKKHEEIEVVCDSCNQKFLIDIN